MTALAIIGWLTLLVVGALLTGGAFLMGAVESGFSGRCGPFPFIVGVIGLAVLAAAIHLAPFTVSFK